MPYVFHVLILVGIYVILSVSLDLVAGYTGLLSIAHAAFFGVGAYATALLTLRWHSGFLVGLLCAMFLAGALGGLVGLPSLRVRDDYFVIASFAFQVIAFSVLNNWVSLTGGPLGVSGIPQPDLFGWAVQGPGAFLVLIGIACAATVWAASRIVNSAFGRVLRATRGDEVFTLAAGKNVASFKVAVFMVSATMAAVAGSLYAAYIGFIDPTSFTVLESIAILAIVVVGGAGSLWGPVIGSVVLVSLPELLRFVGFSSGVAANLRQILYGGLLVAMMLLRPRGLIGKYGFGR